MGSLLSVSLFVVLTDAVAFKGPAATSTPDDNCSLVGGWTPRPTQKSELIRSLNKRAAGDAEQLGFEVNDNTCGYISGSLGTPAIQPHPMDED